MIRHWSDQMIAFSLALASLDMVPARRGFSQTNSDYMAAVEAPLLHYAYETPYWKKGWFQGPRSECWDRLWAPPQLPIQSVQGWVHREIAQAGAFFRHIRETVAA